MERLTINGDLIARDGDPCEYICQGREDCGCDDCPIMAAFEKLSAYEDTGMSPEEIMEMKSVRGDCNEKT